MQTFLQTSSCLTLPLPSSKAGITCHWTSCKHEATAKAIVEGSSRKNKNAPEFCIHLYGVDNICFPDLNQSSWPGQKSTQILGWRPDRAGVFDAIAAVVASEASHLSYE
jgi:hypothetical protein